MNTIISNRESVSCMIDGELSKAQCEATYALLKKESAAGRELEQAWDAYHYVGDVLRSEELCAPLSPGFSAKFSALLEQEPVVLAPKPALESHPAADLVAATSVASTGLARYVAMTSMAAAVIVAFVMTPQLIPLLNSSHDGANQVARTEVDEPFASGPKLTANSSASVGVVAKETEFAPKLENQVEMLRDPRLDSYLLAHQKVSPALDNGGRYIQRANVVSTNRTEK